MADELKMNLFYDNRLESYATIFNHDWARRFNELTDGTKLDPAGFALSMSWRAAANTHVFPWIVVTTLNGFWEGYAQHSGFTPAFVGAMAVEVPKRMGAAPMDSVQRRALRLALQQFANELHEKIESNPPSELSRESIWKQLTTLSEFQIGLWGSQQLVYSSLFFAYENFVKDIVAIAKNKADYKGFPFPQLVADVKEHFGDVIAAQTLEGQFIDVVRYARHCLAHRGGRESPELKATRHSIKVVDGIIQIAAPDNRGCLRGLESRATILAEAAIKMPQFKANLPNGGRNE